MPRELDNRKRAWDAANPEKAKASRKKWRASNPEKEREYGRRYRKKHPDRVRETRRKYQLGHQESERERRRRAYESAPEEARRRARNWYAVNRERIRDRIRRKKYGVSDSDIAKLTEHQGGRCASCGDVVAEDQSKSRSPRTLDIDHDHATGVVRGLLCRGCNLAIGYAKESPRRLRCMAAYLERTKARIA